MELHPLHQNLDTSFVNVSALVKYLRRRQFVGCIKIQLNGYKAEIQLGRENQLKVIERDEISGRVSEGKEAFQRLLIRAREPGGSVNVFQEKENKKPSPEPTKTKTVQSVEVTAVKKPAVPTNGTAKKPPAQTPPPIPQPETEPFLPQPLASNGNGFSSNGHLPSPPVEAKPVTVVEPVGIAVQEEEVEDHASGPSLPDFPFELSNNFERRAKKKSISSEDWQVLMKLSVEMLGVLDKCLAKHNLDFTAAFEKVRMEIAEDYPFMNPSEGIFNYKSGRIEMTRRVNENMFVSSIVESIRKIVTRLGENPRFSEQHRTISQVLVALLEKRKPHYDKFGFSKPLRRILGV